MNITTYTTYKIACGRTFDFIPLRPQGTTCIYVLSSLLVALIPPTAFLNIIPFFVIMKTKKLHTPPNILLACTALCDFLSAIVSMPLWTFIWLFAIHEQHYCSIFILAVFAAHTLSYLSFLLVSFISIDRYLAIFKPFFYEEKIACNPHFYVRFVIALTLSVAAINGVSLLTSNKKLIEIIILLSVPPFILQSIYIHIKVLRKVKNVRKNIAAGSIDKIVYPNTKLYMDAISPETSEFYSCTKSDEEAKLDRRKTRKLAKQVNIYYLTSLLLVSLVICYLPYILITLMLRIMPWLRMEEWTIVVYMWSYVVTCIKSLANPLMYCFRSRILRKHIRKTSREFNIIRR